MDTSGGDLVTIDYVVLAIYFVAVLIVGIWSGRRGKNDNVHGFFLAGRNMNWIMVGTGLFATNIGSTHFIGLTGSAASSGIGIAGFELNAMFILLMLGWLFVPVYLAGAVYTMPEYLHKRFGGQRIQIYLSVLALILSIFIRISTDIYAGATFIEQTMSWGTYPAILSLLAISALFSVVGGLTAVMWTDFVQTILIIAGAATIATLSFVDVGGYSALVFKFPDSLPLNSTFIGFNADNQSCSRVTDQYLHLLRPINDPSMPWTGMVFGITISAVWGWCSDQVQVQRTLAAKNVSHAKGGCVLAGYLKILPLFLFVFPGMAARIMFPNEMGCSAPEACKELCGSPYGCTDIAYPLLVKTLMPSGAKGFVMSMMLSAIMSSLTSVFNSSSTLFTMDIWTKIRKNAKEVELVIVGKIFIVVMVAISVAWVPVIKLAQGSQLYHYTQSVISYLAPPICAVYVLAIFWPRTNEKGAFWALMLGLAIGVSRFIAEFSYSVPACATGLPDPRPAIIANVHYLHFGCILFVVTLFTTIAITLVTEPIPESRLYRLTFWTIHSREIRVNTDEDTNACPSPSEGIPQMDLEQNEPPSRANVFLMKLCGVSNVSKGEAGMQTQSGTTPKEEAEMASLLLREKPFWRFVCNVNGCFLLITAIFIWAFYA